MDTKFIKAGAMSACILLVVLLSVISGFIPYFAIILSIFATGLTSYIHIKWGKLASVISIVLTSGIVLALIRDIESILIVALCIAPGLVSGIMICKNKEYYAQLIGVCASFVAIVIVTMLWAGYGFENGAGGIIDASVLNMKEALIVAVPQENIAELESILNITASYIKMMFPSFVILLSLFFGYFHLAVLRAFVNKISKISYSYVPFCMHKTPKHMSYMYFILVIFTMFLNAESKMGVALNNIAIIIDFIMAFCGFSFIEYLFKGRLKYGFVRAFIYVGAFVIGGSLIIQILSIIGMLDSFMNYRRIERNGE